MKNIPIPYAEGHLELRLEEACIAGVLKSGAHEYVPALSQQELVHTALQNPIGTAALRKMAEGAERLLLITSDHTRPVPSRITLPLLLTEIRSGNPGVKIKILIATGFHRLTTREEMLQKFGREIVEKEEIINHDARDAGNMVCKGILPSGGELWLNSLVDWADLVISEGFIEPHFFAGFSGGRKSILPGIASQKTVLANHCARFIADRNARTGILRENPIHKDMLFAAKAAGLAFILNVVIDSEKKIVHAFAGDPEAAHGQGCDFVARLAKVRAVEADIVVTSNGGYPLDQNIYQAVKGMTAAEACVKKGGVIIIAAACKDGHGGEAFYRWFKDAASPGEVADKISRIPQQETLADQWEAQILARLLMKCRVILVTDQCSPELIRDMHMLHAPDLQKAMETAKDILGRDAKVTVIPDGVSVIVE